MHPWTPDVELDDEIARRLLARRFPELEPIEMRLFGRGWDNHAYLVNDRIVFRIPHRKMGGELMETECAILGGLSSKGLSLPIPVPLYAAQPSEDFPYIIAGYPLIEGATADSVEWALEERSKNAAAIGEFLSRLHSVEMSIPNAPGDTIRRADLAFRLQKMLPAITEETAAFAAIMKDLAQTPAHQGPPRWVHGDLYVRHLLVDSNRSVCGVIDWGDSHLGDPALDISIAWAFLPPSARSVFREAYGGVDEATWRRARFRAMSACIYLGGYARESKDAHLKRECDFMVRNLLDGE